MKACGSRSETSEEVANDSVALGDVIFIKLRSGSWWPAQVVDENSVNKSVKPSNRRKRLPGEVLVRHYGSYTYSYADPIKYGSEFKTILEQNDGSLRKILLQALEKDLPSTKSHRSKGSSSSKPKGTSSKNAAGKRKSNGQDEEQNTIKRQKQKETLDGDASQSHVTDETNSLGKSPELSSRRIRVMENLGLIAPAGSPFQKKCT
ncbi:uncharacterized protein LOC109795870 [Cajanus cajan]|uniref:uncharacterized protein LOC109795870 n=1 Tax=Cajanus cajan TaxID=3821 RepID=UPI00098DCF5D|nr:uncharacterized protein LOC109795870 [Cajanus cajan]XP_020211022.1 uncharacterized protein LOC109795870 [Cajanus cajan]